MSKLEQAKVAIEQGNIDFAQRSLAELIIEEPNNIEGWLMLSQVVPQQQAIECLEKVLALEPNHAEAIERLSNLQKAASYLNEVDFSIEDISEPPQQVDLSEESNLSTEGEDNFGDLHDELAADSQQNVEDDNFSSADVIDIETEKEETLEPEIDKEVEEPLEEILEEPIEELADEFSDKPPIETGDEDEASSTSPPNENILTEPEPESHPIEDEIPTLDDASLPPYDQSDSLKEIWEEPQEKPPPKVNSKPKSKPWFTKSILKSLIALLVFCSLISSGLYWYYQEGPCGINKIGNVYLQMDNLVTQWDKAMASASTSSRLTIMDPIMKMVEIRRELKRMDVPVCMRPVRDDLDLSMALTLEAYDKFLRYEGEIEILKKFQQASLHRKMYERRLQELFSCAPFNCSQ